jgi:transposase
MNSTTNSSLIYIGLDVDDNLFHASAFNKDTGELVNFVCKPTIAALTLKLETLPYDKSRIRICYEASYIGFSLKRDLNKQGYQCEVIAPSMTPKKPGRQVKTDRVDSENLAQYYANSLLTIIPEPNQETERDRDLIRTRQFIFLNLERVKKYILSSLRKNNYNFKAETEFKSHWTKFHRRWLERIIEQNQDNSFGINLKFLYEQENYLQNQLDKYGREILALSQKPLHAEKVKSLICYRGIKALTAMKIISEIGDVTRFPHPRKLVSWAGMDIR